MTYQVWIGQCGAHWVRFSREEHSTFDSALEEARNAKEEGVSVGISEGYANITEISSFDLR